MESLLGEAQDAALRLVFDRRLKVEFHGSKSRSIACPAPTAILASKTSL